MIQKLEQSVVGTDYGCGGASFSEVIDKVNEVIDYINSRPEEIPPYCKGVKGHPDPAGVSDLEGAAEEYASKTLCDPDDGPSTGLAKDAFIAGANYQRLKRLAEAAKSSSHLDAYIEGVRRSIEKQIGQLPPPPPGYYYTWELDTIRKEGQSFTAIARPLLKQINPEQ